MGTQSARLWYGDKDHKEIYFNGHYHNEIHKTLRGPRVYPPTLIWKKISTISAFSIFFTTDPTQSQLAGHKLVDEYGMRIRFNPGGVITKCGAYYYGLDTGIFNHGEHNKATIAFTGEEITWAQIEGYASYKGTICYSPANVSIFNNHPYGLNADGIWSVYGGYQLVLVSFYDVDGNEMRIHDKSIGVGMETRLFYDLDAMKSWLMS